MFYVFNSDAAAVTYLLAEYPAGVASGVNAAGQLSSVNSSDVSTCSVHVQIT